MKILRLLGLAVLFLGPASFSLFAQMTGSQPQEDCLIVESELADYTNEGLSLKGSVNIWHPLGTISANQMVMHPPRENEKGPIGLMLLEDKVVFAFKNGEELSCGRARLDLPAGTGQFYGSESQEFVTYQEERVQKSESSQSGTLFVKACQMSVKLASNQEVVKDVPKAAICSIQANCAVQGHLAFSSPKGMLRAANQEGGDGRIDFAAESMLWDESSGILKLKDDVDVDQNGIVHLKTPGDVSIYRRIEEGKTTLKGIKSEGGTILTYFKNGDQLSHKLTCQGPVIIDHERMQTRLVSGENCQECPPADNQVVEQVHFEDSKGEIFSDRVLIKYAFQGRVIVVSKIYLIGHVKITNRLKSYDDDSVIVHQYVLADLVEFAPDTNQMIFKSSGNGGRVLFFDKVNDLQVSAPELKIIRDKATKQDSVKGIGDVRFNFLENEFEQLRRRFSWDKDETIKAA